MKASAPAKSHASTISAKAVLRDNSSRDREPPVEDVVSRQPVHDLVDRDRAAKLLKISPRTLDRWHLMRIGPPRIKTGRFVRYRLRAISEWLRGCETVGPRTS